MNKKNIVCVVVGVLVGVAVGFGVACFYKSGSWSTAGGSGNVFIFGKTKVGDTLAGLKVSAIAPIEGIQTPFGPDNVQVKFVGQSTVKASYSYNMNEVFGMPMACFTVTDNSLPRMPKQQESMVFCLRDTKKFTELFGKKYGSGEATVVVENFDLVMAPAEVISQADLVRVVSKTK